jgi:hypothetical protein
LADWSQSILDIAIHIIILRTHIRRIRMTRINIDIPDDVHARLKLIASAEGKGFYQWLKDYLVLACPDEQTLLDNLADIRRDFGK